MSNDIKGFGWDHKFQPNLEDLVVSLFDMN